MDEGEEKGRGASKHYRPREEIRKQIGFVRYCSFESEYRGDSFSSLFVSLFLYELMLSLSEGERTFLSLSLSSLYTPPATYAVCKSRRECVSVRITNRKRFSYLPFIKRNEHVRIDIRPISVSTLASAFFSPCCPAANALLLPAGPPLPPLRLLLHSRSNRDSITREK